MYDHKKSTRFDIQFNKNFFKVLFHTDSTQWPNTELWIDSQWISQTMGYLEAFHGITYSFIIYENEI